MMMKAKQIALPTTVGDGEVLLSFDGKIAYSGEVSTGIAIPAGTTLDRPTDVSAGMVRFNTDLNLLEIYEGTKWIQVGKSSKIGSDDGDTYVDTQEEAGKLVIAIDAVNKIVFENIDAETVSITVDSTGADANLVLTPKGAGEVRLPSDYVPVTDESVITKGFFDANKFPAGGLAGQVIKKIDATTADWADLIENSKGVTLYVDTRNGDDTFAGSYDRPFKTITAALDAVTVASSRIIVAPGIYEEDLVIDIPVIIEGAGPASSPLVSIHGNHSLTSDATRFGLSNVKLDVETNNGAVFKFEDSVGNVVFDRVAMPLATDAFPSISFEGDASGSFMFKDCAIDGLVSIDSTSTSSFTVFLVGGTGVTNVVQKDIASIVAISDSRIVGSLTHETGVLIVNNVHKIGGLNSSADLGFIEINKSSFFDSENAQFNTATKTGDCEYVFSYSARDLDTVWTGVETIIADIASIKTEFEPDNYVVADKAVNSHLAGIDAAFAAAGANVVLLNATGTVAVTTKENIVIVTATGVDVTLPDVTGIMDGTKVVIKDGFGVSATPITITAAVNTTIDGAATAVIEFARESVTLVKAGTNWNIV